MTHYFSPEGESCKKPGLGTLVGGGTGCNGEKFAFELQAETGQGPRSWPINNFGTIQQVELGGMAKTHQYLFFGNPSFDITCLMGAKR
jgi:hypothetical protein